VISGPQLALVFRRSASGCFLRTNSTYQQVSNEDQIYALKIAYTLFHGIRIIESSLVLYGCDQQTHIRLLCSNKSWKVTSYFFQQSATVGHCKVIPLVTEASRVLHRLVSSQLLFRDINHRPAFITYRSRIKTLLRLGWTEQSKNVRYLKFGLAKTLS
jgi:hypothetical protein